MSKIELDTNEIQPLINMLYLSGESKVIKLGNYIKKDSLKRLEDARKQLTLF